eukprot:GHVU01059872.1.p1 GENE.GHVU01059872.1~~GHVU01059872.1.p1  ORF type:complete len:210 (+),score=37.00 GHVU01059872.1:44-631(+)
MQTRRTGNGMKEKTPPQPGSDAVAQKTKTARLVTASAKANPAAASIAASSSALSISPTSPSNATSPTGNGGGTELPTGVQEPPPPSLTDPAAESMSGALAAAAVQAQLPAHPAASNQMAGSASTFSGDGNFAQQKAPRRRVTPLTEEAIRAATDEDLREEDGESFFLNVPINQLSYDTCRLACNRFQCKGYSSLG